MFKLKTFAFSVLLGALATLAVAGPSQDGESPLGGQRTMPGRGAWGHPLAAAQAQLQTSQLTSDIQVSGQIRPEDIAVLKKQGVKTVIDLRPDGEAPDQPSSSAMAQAAEQAGLQFGYVPVLAGSDVPPSAVDALRQLLTRSPRPVLLYCRSGARAVRTWALTEAARPGGLDAATIAQHAQDAGRPVNDLREQIAQRIAARGVRP
jgi:uncharacterized protein (TIGR01244 family)